MILGSFSYAIPVPASATYRVRLHFAETYWGATGGGAGGSGKRVFSANLEDGAPELANYDINADVGPMTAVVKEYTLAVSDGTLTIDFSASVDRPIISAIEVFRIGTAGATAGKAGLNAPLRQTTPVTYTDFQHTDYGYDGVGRLATESSGGGTTTYGYDRVGNRTLVMRNGVTTNLSYNAANQRQGVGWSYDAAGNPESVAGIRYYFDALNRLTRIENQDKSQFGYNGDGVLVWRGILDDDYDVNDLVWFVNDLAAPLSQPLVIAQQGGSTTEAWYGIDRLATRTVGGTARSWPLHDGVGSVRATLNDAGISISSPQFDAWGYNQEEDLNDDLFGFAGEYTDLPSGLVYLRARWYDPAEGTLLGRDPYMGRSEQPPSLHAYMYVWNAPTMYNDPSGRDPWWHDVPLAEDIKDPCGQNGFIGPYLQAECLARDPNYNLADAYDNETPENSYHFDYRWRLRPGTVATLQRYWPDIQASAQRHNPAFLGYPKYSLCNSWFLSL